MSGVDLGGREIRKGAAAAVLSWVGEGGGSSPSRVGSLVEGISAAGRAEYHAARVVFNALVIVALIALALRGVRYVPGSAAALLRRNFLVYGVGGVIAPFVGIKLIDLILQLIPGVS